MPPFLGTDLLVGKRVRLARPTHDDVATIAAWSLDLEYQRLLRRGMVYPGSVEEHRGWFEEMAKGELMFPFSVRTLVEDRLVGLLVIKDIMWQARHCSFFIGIGESSERGRGYGSDAVRVLLQYAFLEMNLHRVGLEVMAYNADAIRAYEAAGFQHDGRLRAFVYRDGVYYDVLLMSVLRAEWEAQTGQPPVSYPGAEA
jgi:RimJ/RimL family protein N-acetyltransferase